MLYFDTPPQAAYDRLREVSLGARSATIFLLWRRCLGTERSSRAMIQIVEAACMCMHVCNNIPEIEEEEIIKTYRYAPPGRVGPFAFASTLVGLDFAVLQHF